MYKLDRIRVKALAERIEQSLVELPFCTDVQPRSQWIHGSPGGSDSYSLVFDTTPDHLYDVADLVDTAIVTHNQQLIQENHPSVFNRRYLYEPESWKAKYWYIDLITAHDLDRMLVFEIEKVPITTFVAKGREYVVRDQEAVRVFETVCEGRDVTWTDEHGNLRFVQGQHLEPAQFNHYERELKFCFFDKFPSQEFLK